MCRLIQFLYSGSVKVGVSFFFYLTYLHNRTSEVRRTHAVAHQERNLKKSTNILNNLLQSSSVSGQRVRVLLDATFELLNRGNVGQQWKRDDSSRRQELEKQVGRTNAPFPSSTREPETCLALAAKLNALRLVINGSMVRITFHYLEPFSHNYLCEDWILKCEMASLVCIVVYHLMGRLIAKVNVSPCSGNG